MTRDRGFGLLPRSSLCSPPDSRPAAATTTTTAATTHQRRRARDLGLISEGTLLVGTDTPFPPFEIGRAARHHRATTST